jgi:8-oxo-dGTP diphosphatase
MLPGTKIFIKNIKTKKWLFLLRDDIETIPHPNMWSLVGGGLESYENMLEGLYREIEEEVNIYVQNVSFLVKEDIQIVENKIYYVPMHVFKGETTADISDIVVGEGQKANYFTLDEALKLDNIIPLIKEFIKEYKHKLEK